LTPPGRFLDATNAFFLQGMNQQSILSLWNLQFLNSS
jgi:hypothetical protein